MGSSSQESSGTASALFVIIALALSVLVLWWQGDRLIVRAFVGTAWGLYCLYAFGIAPLLKRKAERNSDARIP